MGNNEGFLTMGNDQCILTLDNGLGVLSGLSQLFAFNSKNVDEYVETERSSFKNALNYKLTEADKKKFRKFYLALLEEVKREYIQLKKEVALKKMFFKNIINKLQNILNPRRNENNIVKRN